MYKKIEFKIVNNETSRYDEISNRFLIYSKHETQIIKRNLNNQFRVIQKFIN
jgi:hypothetical protein